MIPLMRSDEGMKHSLLMLLGGAPLTNFEFEALLRLVNTTDAWSVTERARAAKLIIRHKEVL